jgi:hypothetical protein
MPSVNNAGRFIWGSAWRLEPRRGNSKRDAELSGVALRLFAAGWHRSTCDLS